MFLSYSVSSNLSTCPIWTGDIVNVLDLLAGVIGNSFMISIMDSHEILQQICFWKRKHGLYLSFNSIGTITPEELNKAAPWLSWDVCLKLWAQQELFLFFDTLTERDEAYQKTIGDDGPTTLNPYNGPARIYALTCSPQGQLLNENT